MATIISLDKFYYSLAAAFKILLVAPVMNYLNEETYKVN